MKKDSAAYTKGSIGKTLIKTAFAMVPGTLAMSGYNLADAFFVGRLGREPLAAMGFTFPVIMLAWCIFHGVGVGVVATVSQSLGGGRRNKAAGLVECGILLSVLISVVIAVLGMAGCGWIFRQFGARGNTLVLVTAYMNIWFFGCVTGTLSGLGNSLLIAAGDARTAAVMMMSGMVLNALLDPLMIFGLGPFPAWGIRGAALATVLSQMLAAGTVLAIVKFRHGLIRFEKIPLKRLVTAWKMIIRFAVPATIGMLMMPAGMAVVTRVTATFGDAVVAATAAAGRVEAVAFILPMAMGISLVPMIGQNYGARLYGRIRGIQRFSIRFAGLYLLVMAVLFFFLAPVVANWFAPGDAEVRRVMILGMRIVPWGFSFIEIHRYGGFFFTGSGRPSVAAWLNGIRMLGLLVPLSLLALPFDSVTILFCARLLADTLSGLLAWYASSRLMKALPANGAVPPVPDKRFFGLMQMFPAPLARRKRGKNEI
ncbi:MAG: MATE family efflux transporter [Lentisphaeria bacterium]|nr:MATE family efflux transporter [Lentisphaeria bacterium]